MSSPEPTQQNQRASIAPDHVNIADSGYHNQDYLQLSVENHARNNPYDYSG